MLERPRLTHSSGETRSEWSLLSAKMWSLDDENAQSAGLGAGVAVIARNSFPENDIGERKKAPR